MQSYLLQTNFFIYDYKLFSFQQADKLASADILVKDLYIENACLTAHMKRLQERCLVLSGLDVGSSSM